MAYGLKYSFERSFEWGGSYFALPVPCTLRIFEDGFTGDGIELEAWARFRLNSL